MGSRDSLGEALQALRWPRALKAPLIGALWLFLAVSVGRAILAVSESFSLGSLMRAFILPLALMGLLTVLSLTSFQNVRLSFAWPVVSVNQMVVLLLVAPLCAYFTLSISHVNLTWFIIILAALVGCAFSLFLAASRGDIYPLVSFWLILPFLAFIEWDVKTFWPAVGNWITETGIPLSSLFLWLFAGTVIARRFALSKQGFARTSLDKYFFALVSALFVSVLCSADPGVSVKVFVPVALSMPLFFFLTTNYLRMKRDLRIFLWGMVGYAVLRVFFAYYFGITGRLSEVVVSIDQVMIPVLVSLILISSSKLQRVAGTVVILFLLRVPIELQSRGVILIFSMTALMFLLLYKRYKARVLIGMVLLALAAGVLFDVRDTFQKFVKWTSFDAALQEQAMRLDGWQAAWRMMMDHPFSGIGLGMWSQFIPLYGRAFTWSVGGTRETQTSFIPHAHNLYLQYGAEAGIAAMLALGLLVVAATRKCICLVRTLHDRESHTLAVGLLWAIVGYAVGALVGMGGFAFYWYLDVGGLFWTVMGLIVSLERIAHSDGGNTP